MPLHKIQDSAPLTSVTATSRLRYTRLAAVLTRKESLEAIQKVIAEVTTPSYKVDKAALRTALLTGLDAAP